MHTLTKLDLEGCTFVIPAPGTNKQNTSIKADTQENIIYVKFSGETSNKDIDQFTGANAVQADFSLNEEITVDKRYDVSGSKVDFVDGFIIVKLETKKERIIKLG